MDRPRLISTALHETLIEAGAPVDPPTVVVTAALVVRNPLAGKGAVADLAELEALGSEASALLAAKAGADVMWDRV